MFLNSVYISILLTVLACPFAAMAVEGWLSDTKVYFGGVYINLRGHQLKSLLEGGGYRPSSCWVTWVIWNSLEVL